MNIVGLDLSLTATGVAYADGSLRTLTSKATGMERLLELRCMIMAYLALLDIAEKRPADLVAIEGYAFGRPNQATHLGELGGVVRLALYENGIPYVDVPPSSLKVFATGRGNAPKNDMLVAAVKRLGYDGVSNDEADAAWLRAMALHHYGEPIVDVPQAHLRGLEKVAWPVLDDRSAA